ncbi:MAG: hypothetical protein L3J06_03690 [Cyclobacteriaceae bacterium]|nr:hypothetical protein [Cyclobacteriaceae bacterium]
MNDLLKAKPVLKTLTIYVGIIIGGLVLLFLLPGCSDTCKTTSTYITYNPIYASMSSLRSQVEILPPQPGETQGKIYVYGDYLLLGDPGKGIHVFNNADKTNPIAVSFINIPGNVDMAVRGGKLYADSYFDLLVFDMLDPTNINLVNRIEEAFPTYTNQFGNWSSSGTDQVLIELQELDVVEVSNNCASNKGVMYLEGDILFMNANSSFANTMGEISNPTVGVGGSMARFTIVNNYLYTVDENALHAFDISSPENPVNKSKVDLGWGIETIFPFKNNLFIGSTTGMHIYSIDNPVEPQFMSMSVHVTTCDPVVANDKYAFVTLRSENNNGGWCGDTFTNQLEVIDIADVTNSKLLHQFNMISPHGLGIDGNTLFVTEGDDGLKIFDITDVAKIDENLLQHITGFNAFDVIPINGTLILTGNDGLYQFDYTNLDEIKLLSLIPATQW